MSTSKNRIHTTACGTEPYDKCWGVGAKKKLTSGGFSPFERINRLRELYKVTPLCLDATRAVVITDVYKQYESQPMIIKKARMLEKYMEVCPLHYEEGELLLTDPGVPINGAPVFPETFNWLYDELRDLPLNKRDYNPSMYDEKTKEDILSVEDYWKGKDIKTIALARMPEEVKKGCLSAGRMGIINPGVNIDYGVGHITVDFEYALKKGLGGIKADVRRNMEKLGVPTNVAGLKSLQFHEAQLIALDAVSNYLRRYAAFAREKIGEYESAQTKAELQHLSEICEHLAEEPARDFWEAMQMVQTIMMVQFMEEGGHAISYGRSDQYLYPYYKDSLDKGTYTKEFMLELIEFLYIKSVTHDMLAQNTGTDQWRGGTKGWSGSALIVGGVDKDGNDVTNDLTFMFLDAMVHTRMINPYVAVRWHEGTPYELKVKAAEVVRLGIGHPKFLSDKTCIDALMRLGVSLEDARDYVNVGCVELEAPGKTFGWHDNTTFTLPKVLELALNNGRCLDCAGENCPNYHTSCRGAGKSLGLETGFLKDFKTFDEVIVAYEAQLKYWADRAVMCIDLIQEVQIENDDYPFTASLISDCTESDKSLMMGGARYNFTGVQAHGPATVADSLTTLKKLVYDDKKVTPEEYYDALTTNWEGHERLYRLVNSEKVPHYGNDDDYADDMMKYVMKSFGDTFQSYPATRGGIGKIKTGSFSVAMNVLFGLFCGATPDGRKHHEPISENMGAARTPVMNRDRSGPTAFARSVGKVDCAQHASGTLINMKFGVETMSGDQGLENFIDLLDGYFAANPQHIQFMVADRETPIDAREKPEEYQDLLVRVSGFSSQFVTLSPAFQNELINRTEQSFD